jgi:hypothetical protein
MFRSCAGPLLFVAMLFAGGCGSVDSRTSEVQDQIKEGLERGMGKSLTRVKLQPDGDTSFRGTATASDGTVFTVTATREGGKLTYEATSKDGKSVFRGTNLMVTASVLAKKDIAAGTTIDDPLALFEAGTQYSQGEEPPDIYLFNNLVLLKGKVLKNALKQGQVLKAADVTEPDGSPMRVPGQ